MGLKERATQATGDDFARAAWQRWEKLGEELQDDVSGFNSRQGGAGFSRTGPDQFHVSHSLSGLVLAVTADFDARIIRYDFEQLNAKSAGVPEGGMLSMRQTPGGEVEFYSADEQLTSEETRKILLEPVLLPPEMAA